MEDKKKILIIGQPIAGMDIKKQTYISVLNLWNPANMMDLYFKHNVIPTVSVMSDFPIDYSRNKFVDDSLDKGADYLMFMDMDMTWPADMFQKLFELISDETPVVSGMYYVKNDPFRPVCGRYSEWGDGLEDHKEELDKLGFVHDGKQLINWQSFTYFNKERPFLADVIGMGCVLVKADVFRKLRELPDDPHRYFRYSPDPRKKGTHNCISEDMYFCAKLKKAGVPILIDPRVQCGHLMSMESNVQLYEAQRDASFEQERVKFPKSYEQIMGKVLDVRHEQNGKVTSGKTIQE